MKKSVVSIFNRKKVTGLYVSQNTVDLVVCKDTLKGPRLIKFAQVYIYPKDADKEEIIPEAVPGTLGDGNQTQRNAAKKTRDDYIVGAIQRVFKESNIKPGNVVSAIPSEDTMVRYFQMPKMPKQEWASAINFEAKRYIPFRMEDVSSDFQVIQNSTSPGIMDVVFVAVKRSAMERFVRLLERAGLTPMSIEPAPFSLIRALDVADQINKKINTAVVNIKEGIANINILRNGVPYLIRDVPLEAGATEDKSFEPIFEKLLAEVKLSFDFYEKQFPSESIDKIIIYSLLPLENWHELVGKELQIPVEVGDPLRGIRIKKDMVPPKLAISFGLALRGISRPFIDVNLYKEKLFAYKREELFLKILFLEASAAVFLLIILRVLCIRAIMPLSNEFNRTMSERPKVQVNIQGNTIDQLERIKNGMEARKILLENIISKRIYLTTMLKDLAELLPDDIWLTEVNFEETVDKKDISKISRQLNIKGYCVIGDRVSETDTVNNFLLDLKQGVSINKGMSAANIMSVEKTKIDDEEVAMFEILFTGQ